MMTHREREGEYGSDKKKTTKRRGRGSEGAMKESKKKQEKQMESGEEDGVRPSGGNGHWAN